MDIDEDIIATRSPLVFFVNGKKVVEENPHAEWTLAYYLRHKLRLCGTKESCGEGGCGACTVMLSKLDKLTSSIINLAVNACLTPLCSVHESAIITTEGIGCIKTGLHPVQERIAKSHGTQCGYCTPGFVMSMYTLLRNNGDPSEHELESALQGNLCRCTGYRPILEGFKTFCSGKSSSVKNGCCNAISNGTCCKENVLDENVGDHLFNECEFKPYDPSQDPIFPPELLQKGTREDLVTFSGSNVFWHIVRTKKKLLELRKRFPKAKIVAGNTEIGVDVKFKKHYYGRYIQIDNIPELCGIQLNEDSFVIGASVTLTKLKSFCKTQKKRTGDIFHVISQMLHLFGGQQIRNVATIGGNIITASPISDLSPIFMAAGCSATLATKHESESGEWSRNVKMDENFFQRYRETIIKPEEILECITIPLTQPHEFIWCAKMSRRKDDDIAIVNTCMRVKFCKNMDEVEDIALAYGGIGPTTKLSKQAVRFLINRKWNTIVMDDVTDILLQEFSLLEDAPGGMIAYRQSLISNFFYKFHATVSHWLNSQRGSGTLTGQTNCKEDFSAIRPWENRKTKSSQLYEIKVEAEKTIEAQDPIGKPLIHSSALKHATGEATYTDDTPPQVGELFGAFVLSKIAYGNILGIDSSEALKLPGVVEFFDSTSVPQEKNLFGPIVQDEELFASKQITCQGQIVGFVVAVDPFTAEKAASLVKIECQELEPILTIEDAIKHESFYGTERSIKCGDVGTAFASCDNIIEGQMRIGGQEHFYLETQSCVTTPKEDDEIDILLATQAPHYVQMAVAKYLSIPANRVRVRCRRMGGAFGGKETRSAIIALATSIAAKKLGVAVRCAMNRWDDMNATGGRHPFLCKYKAGYTKTGNFIAVEASLYSNGGNSSEASTMVMEKALMSIDGPYTIPNWFCKGRACKTNLPSNTAFRGYGSPQALLFIENIFDLVAETLKLDPHKIREIHLKRTGDSTPYGFPMENCTLLRCWSECVSNSLYFTRKCRDKENVEEFNNNNRWKKRGIILMPTKHDVGFHVGFLNQGGALVMIYTDGTVSLNHGGTEMGQGLLIKMAQVASKSLGISIEKIYFSETSSDKIPNASGTCASMSSDLNGMAVMNACKKLVRRLEPFKKSNPNGKWEDWVLAAYMNKVNLSATGFHQVDINYNFDGYDDGKRAFDYSSFGVACTEVEIDCLTGEHTVLRTDIVMDVGESLNPAVDIGQIEGAFIQGYGLFTMEELLFSPKGIMLTKGPGMYKIPSVGGIPKEFNVSLLRGAPNPRAVYSSKAIGEPPLFLGASVYLAIKEAIKSFRRDNNLSTVFTLDSPATAERILLACSNKENVCKNNLSEKCKSWSIIV